MLIFGVALQKAHVKSWIERLGLDWEPSWVGTLKSCDLPSCTGAMFAAWVAGKDPHGLVFPPLTLLLGLTVPTALSSYVFGNLCFIFKFTSILRMASPVTILAMESEGPTFFNCMIVSVTVLTVFCLWNYST
jgi:hypothetical protein